MQKLTCRITNAHKKLANTANIHRALPQVPISMNMASCITDPHSEVAELRWLERECMTHQLIAEIDSEKGMQANFAYTRLSNQRLISPY